MLKEDLPKKLTGHPNQPKLPLVRVRVEFEVESHGTISVGRFGNHFHGQVANTADMLLFKNVKRKFKKEEDSISGKRTVYVYNILYILGQ